MVRACAKSIILQDLGNTVGGDLLAALAAIATWPSLRRCLSSPYGSDSGAGRLSSRTHSNTAAAREDDADADVYNGQKCITIFFNTQSCSGIRKSMVEEVRCCNRRLFSKWWIWMTIHAEENEKYDEKLKQEIVALFFLARE